MKTKIATILITILFSVSASSICMAGNWDSNNVNPRKAANYQMLQNESDDPYRTNVEVISETVQDKPTFTNKRRDNYYMLLEELEEY